MIEIFCGVFAGIVAAVWFLGWMAARQERRALAAVWRANNPQPPRETGRFAGLVAMVGIIFVFRAVLAVTGIMP
jgi:uncharacterized BrkB/YihY/UPF0761 family membrane protein